MIIAVDFDGILCENAFPKIGKPHYPMVSFVRELMDEGHEVVLWTCRVEQQLDEAVAWCGDRGLYFCAVNDNAPSNKKKYEGVYSTPTRKIHADIYIDDHNPVFILWTYRDHGADGAIKQCINQVKEVISKWHEEN